MRGLGIEFSETWTSCMNCKIRVIIEQSYFGLLAFTGQLPFFLSVHSMSDALDKFHSRKKKWRREEAILKRYLSTTRKPPLLQNSVAAKTERKHHKKLNWNDEIKLRNFEHATKNNP